MEYVAITFYSAAHEIGGVGWLEFGHQIGLLYMYTDFETEILRCLRIEESTHEQLEFGGGAVFRILRGVELGLDVGCEVDSVCSTSIEMKIIIR